MESLSVSYTDLTQSINLALHLVVEQQYQLMLAAWQC
jgi:hypothetical protein